MKLNKLRLDNGSEKPLIALKDLVVFPCNVIPFFVGRTASLLALEAAMENDRELFLAFQRGHMDEPAPEDIHPIGTIARVIQLLKLPDGNIRILVEGLFRVQLKKIKVKHDVIWGQYTLLKEKQNENYFALMHSIKENFIHYTKLSRKKILKETINKVLHSDSPEKLVAHVCANLDIEPEKIIRFLQETDNQKRLDELAVTLQMENESLSLKNDISERVKKRMEQSQKEYFLNEQIKEIQKELGNNDADPDPTSSDDLETRIKKMDLGSEVRQKALTEVKRLSRLQPMSPESGVLRTYLEWIIDLPWNIRTEDQQDITKAAKILDADHFGLEKPKDRILDFIAIRQMKDKIKSPILCIVGPPGTGKTSLGRSIARTLDRKFVRISLGGVRDEAEIRGHRKTYVGALPGKIIQSIKKAGSVNPVFLLDEVDKICSDYRGDPTSALLEVLDPEQNNSFGDHYLEVSFDLSEVMFIATANNLGDIPIPLRDRMEVIKLSGYTMAEKKSIARQFIIPKQMEENGLECADIRFMDDSLDFLIRGYTLEAGVRGMERCIGQILRKIARKILWEKHCRPGVWTINSATLHLNQQTTEVCQTPFDRDVNFSQISVEVDKDMIRKHLGMERLEDDLEALGRPGLAAGLYYDGGGGGVLPIEAIIYNGDGNLLLTGQLGNVMQESAKIALSYLKANYQRFGLQKDFDKKKDIHLHIPQGAIPVDGPSAGIALTAALLSAALKKAVNPGVAMTGEVTLTDRVLPVGGIKEKTLAARRRGFNTIIMPQDNERDIAELPSEIKETISFLFHSSLGNALEDVFPKQAFKVKK